MNRHTLYHNLRDAFDDQGCPICRLCSRAVSRYLGHLLYESVNDVEVRKKIRQSQGFCREHAWQLQQRTDALGIAIIHKDVITNILRRLGREREDEQRTAFTHWWERILPGAASDAARRLARGLAATGECPACRQTTEIEQAYLQTLLQHSADPQLLARWRESGGLCYPHFQHALQLVRDEGALRLLIDVEFARWEQLCDQLSDFIRRHDYLSGSEGFGAESDSWIRAIAKVSGWHSPDSRGR